MTLDDELVEHTARLSALRRRFSVFSETDFFTGENGDVEWLNENGSPMTVGEWEQAERGQLTMVVRTHDRELSCTVRLALLFNRQGSPVDIALPGGPWQDLRDGRTASRFRLPPRCVSWCIERPPAGISASDTTENL